ncbi:glycoside hydrolase family 38 C-terminal domain-containing protein [Bacteroidota bacterium]
MPNCFNNKLILLILLVINFQHASGQELTALSNPWPASSDNYFQGFDKTVSGTELDFFPFLEKGNVALYLGENGLYKSISFKTEPIPTDYNHPNITYIWQSGISKSVEDQLSEFRMSINDQEFLTFRTYKEGELNGWQYSDKRSISLSFTVTSTGKGTGDLFGYMILKLPVKYFSRGEPVTIRMDEIRSHDKDFYMAIQNPVKESLNIDEEAAIVKTDEGPKQTVRVDLTYLGKPTDVNLSFNGKSITTTDINPGKNEIYLYFDPVGQIKKGELSIEIKGRTPIIREVILKPVRHFEVYFLPHSHVDIGFTHKQDEVARLQWKNLDLALDLIQQTADYPEGSKYKWNAEISWVLDGYLKQASEEQRKMLIDAVRNGDIGVDALYASTLTGLQREEELYHNTSFANKMIKEYGFDIQSAMITDVPGYTWGIVPGLSQTGIKYFSIGPNHMPHLPHGGAQVGHSLETWGDVPFYWISPSGKDKILFWMSSHGYSWFHAWSIGNISNAGGTPVLNFLNELEQQKYPYDMVQLRYNIGNDNGPPDPDMAAFFKQWNDKHEWPKFKISTTLEMMREFEQRYEDQIPEVSGDFTPFWQDGGASSATETALNRNVADQLIQVETLLAMTGSENNYQIDLDEAWTNVVLFSEHTWGALQSKSDPDGAFTKDLWNVKQSFVLDAQKSANQLMEIATSAITSTEDDVEALLVINTLSWTRSDLVKLPKEWNTKGYRIIDDKRLEVSTQLLSTGELAFFAKDIPAFGTKKYTFKKGKASPKGNSYVSDLKIGNDLIDIELDSKSGLIKSIIHIPDNHQFIDRNDTVGFNAYWYSGHILDNLNRNHSPKFSIKENGPLISSIVVETSGAGSNSIHQEIEVISGMDKINLINVVDKVRVTDNENVRFSFPFVVPDGKVRIGIPWAVLEPGVNQLDGANKNFYCAQRFLDVSNDEFGMTLTTADAPIWEIGEMSGQYWYTDLKTRPWFKEYKPSQTLFSWTMNNAWFVNYKAYQEGEIKFRYNLIPHGKFSAAQSKKLGMEQTMPLITVPVSGKKPPIQPIFTISGSEDVLVTSFKSSIDDQAWMIRFFNSSDKTNKIVINWANGIDGNTYMSSPLEEKGPETGNSLSLVPWEIITIRKTKR